MQKPSCSQFYTTGVVWLTAGKMRTYSSWHVTPCSNTTGTITSLPTCVRCHVKVTVTVGGLQRCLCRVVDYGASQIPEVRGLTTPHQRKTNEWTESYWSLLNSSSSPWRTWRTADTSHRRKWPTMAASRISSWKEDRQTVWGICWNGGHVKR